MKTFEITWKISGLMPPSAKGFSKYYRLTEDRSYSKRVFGRPDLTINSYSLVPTNLFHQALISEIARKHGLLIGNHRQPYDVPIGGIGMFPVNLRFRIFGEAILLLTIQLPKITQPLSTEELIELQKLSSHPILESIARFCFNVNYFPMPSEVEVKCWNTKPFAKIEAKKNMISKQKLASIVTRHIDLNERATQEMLLKNESLNFNDDLIFIDKQGVAYLEVLSNRNNQDNRYKRILALYEYAIYVKAIQNIFLEDNNEISNKSFHEIENINSVLGEKVLGQSVSARRGWELIKKELGLGRIVLQKTEDNPNCQTKKRVPFYKNPFFVGVSALLTVVASIAAIFQSFKN